jgi:GAF domain-containing protein
MHSIEQVAAAIAAAARTMNHFQSLDRTLQAIAQSAKDSIPGFDLVGISTVDRHGTVETRAATGHLVYEFDKLQYGLGEGPCVAVLGQAHVVVVPRIRHEQRWPAYIPEALRLGLRSQLAVKLSLDDQGTLGGLNMYSTVSDDVDPDAASIAELFAVHAAIALGSARELENLNEALQSRKVIGQALGILMCRYELDEDRAFAFLVRASNAGNIKLRRIAQELVDEQSRKARG